MTVRKTKTAWTVCEGDGQVIRTFRTKSAAKSWMVRDTELLNSLVKFAQKTQERSK